MALQLLYQHYFDYENSTHKNQFPSAEQSIFKAEKLLHSGFQVAILKLNFLSTGRKNED